MTIKIYKFVNEEVLDLFMKEGKLKTSRLGETNDPFEYTPSMSFEKRIQMIMDDVLHHVANIPKGSLPPFSIDEEKRILLDLFIKLRQRMPPYISFSLTCTEPLMWGLYANNHKGACLAFEVEFDSEEGNWPGTYLRLIHYHAHRRSILPLILNHGNSPMSKVSNACIQYFGSCIKSKNWSFEKELRMFIHDDNQLTSENQLLLYNDARAFLKGVILGINNESTIEDIQAVAKAHGFNDDLKVCKSTLSDSEYKVINKYYDDASSAVYGQLKTAFLYNNYIQNWEIICREGEKFFRNLMLERIQSLPQNFIQRTSGDLSNQE